MSALAKTFVIVILVLSTIFLTMSLAVYQHSTDWRAQYETLAKQYQTDVQADLAQIKALESRAAALDDFAKTKDEEIRNLKVSIQSTGERLLSKTAEYTQKLQEYEKLLDDHSKVVTQLEGRMGRVKELEEDLTRTGEERRAALDDKEKSENQIARLMSIKNSLEKDLAELRKEYTSTKSALSDKELVLKQLAAAGVDVERFVHGNPAPPISAKVVAVMDDVQPALVLLSAGSNEKVQTGYEFTVYRDNEFIARVVVEKVLPNRSGARVLFQKAPIRAGDEAATILQ